MSHISQREARALKKRVDELEAAIRRQRFVWGADFVGGVHLGEVTFAYDACIVAQALAARKLGHAVVVKVGQGFRKIDLYALPDKAASI